VKRGRFRIDTTQAEKGSQREEKEKKKNRTPWRKRERWLTKPIIGKAEESHLERGKKNEKKKEKEERSPAAKGKTGGPL